MGRVGFPEMDGPMSNCEQDAESATSEGQARTTNATGFQFGREIIADC